MNALIFVIELLQPVLATQPHSGEANSAVSYNFIPGSMIRGAIIARYLQKNGLSHLNMDDPQTRNYFFNGQVKYLNAYPAHPGDNSRALSKPLSWFVPKDEVAHKTATIYDFALKAEQWEQAPKAPKTGAFCWIQGDEVVLKTPEVQVTVHNASDDPNRKDAGSSQVYRYDALSAGQRFAGAIISEDLDFLQKTLQPLLSNVQLNIGGSFTGGYGAVRITQADIAEDWQEYALSAPIDDSNFDFEEGDDDDLDTFAARLEAGGTSGQDRVTLTCLSDVILRDPDSGQVGNYLKEAIGCKPDQSFYRMRLVGSFNRHWGMPTPQMLAIRAGSVFVFPAEEGEQLYKLVEDGLGERQVEGFGRVAVGLQTKPTYKQKPYTEPAKVLILPKTLSAESTNLAQRMAQRRFEADVDIALTRQINLLSSQMKNLPSATQLSRMRLAARYARHKKKLKPIQDHLENLSDLTKRDWREAKLGKELLLEWLADQMKNSEQNVKLVSPPVVAGRQVDFAEVAPEVTARLIEGVLRRAVKQAKIEAEGGSRG